jgi:hypothetical protein
MRKARSRINPQFLIQFGAHGFDRERHFPDEFRLKSLARKEWAYWHNLLNVPELMEPERYSSAVLKAPVRRAKINRNVF